MITDEQIIAIARALPNKPWGIGSCRADAIAFARAVLAALDEPTKTTPCCDYAGVDHRVRNDP